MKTERRTPVAKQWLALVVVLALLACAGGAGALVEMSMDSDKVSDEQGCAPPPAASSDASLRVDKTANIFDEKNLKRGEIINVDNISGLDQCLGIELPEKRLLYAQVTRKPRQTRVQRDNWQRFPVPANSGIFIVVIPDPNQLKLLDGEHILINFYQANAVQQTRRITIKVDLARR